MALRKPPPCKYRIRLICKKPKIVININKSRPGSHLPGLHNFGATKELDFLKHCSRERRAVHVYRDSKLRERIKPRNKSRRTAGYSVRRDFEAAVPASTPFDTTLCVPGLQRATRTVIRLVEHYPGRRISISNKRAKKTGLIMAT